MVAVAVAELGLEPGSSNAWSTNFAFPPCCSSGIFLFEKGDADALLSHHGEAQECRELHDGPSGRSRGILHALRGNRES